MSLFWCVAHGFGIAIVCALGAAAFLGADALVCWLTNRLRREHGWSDEKIWALRLGTFGFIAAWIIATLLMCGVIK